MPTTTKSKHPQYEQMDQITHIHERSDMYVGASTRQLERDEYTVAVTGKPENQGLNPKIHNSTMTNGVFMNIKKPEVKPKKEVKKPEKELKKETKKPELKVKRNNVAEVILPDLNLKTETVIQLFKDVDYDLRKVRNEKLVKPIYFTQFPRDLDNLQSVQLKKETFIKIVLPLIVAENEKILDDREKLKVLIEKKFKINFSNLFFTKFPNQAIDIKM